MAKLIYSVLMSLDGYIADKNGNFSWAEPDEEVRSFVNELGRSVGTYLYGRGMYDVMAVCHLFIAPPIIVGDGNSAFPSGTHLELTLQDERRFRNGMLYLRYRSTTSQSA